MTNVKAVYATSTNLGRLDLALAHANSEIYTLAQSVTR